MIDPHSEPSAATRRPPAVEVEAELQRVLASRCFEQAGRAKEFLRFVVCETIAGRGERLKGYTIGIQVFGRPPDFDAQTDPLVRVEARRLRSRLLEYYATEGRADLVRIELPRGGYAPQFAYAADRATTPLASGRPSTASSTRASAPVLRRIAFVTPVIAAALALWLLPVEWRERVVGRAMREATPQNTALSAPPVPRRATVLLPTFGNLSGESDFDYFSYGITEDVGADLGTLGMLVIRGADQSARSAVRSDDASSSPTPEYVLIGSVQPAPDRIRVYARVVVASTGAQLWAEAFDEPADIKALLSIQERIAERVSSAIALPFGPIFRQEALKAESKPAEYLDTYDCVLKYRYYRRNIDPRGHAQSLDCFRQAVVREPRYADAWAGLALIYLDEYLYGYDPQAGDALARALEAARTALDVDGGNALADLAIARVRFALGDLAGFERAAGRVEMSIPSNPDDLMMIGVLFGVAGNWDRGLPIIDRAYALSGPGTTGMLSAGYTIHALQTGDYDEALRQALRFDSPHWYVATVLVVVAASLAERPDIAHRAAEQLLAEQPNFGRGARTQLAKWHMNDELYERFVSGLNRAGIATP